MVELSPHTHAVLALAQQLPRPKSAYYSSQHEMRNVNELIIEGLLEPNEYVSGLGLSKRGAELLAMMDEAADKWGDNRYKDRANYLLENSS